MTTYRSDCGCIASRPEPSPAEFTSLENYALAAECWRQNWERVTAEHVYQCPKSAYYVAPTYPRCIVCGSESAPILADRPEDYDAAGRHVGACYCRQHVPAGVPTVMEDRTMRVELWTIGELVTWYDQFDSGEWAHGLDVDGAIICPVCGSEQDYPDSPHDCTLDPALREADSEMHVFEYYGVSTEATR